MRNGTGDLIHYYLNSFVLVPPNCLLLLVSSEPDFPVISHSYNNSSKISSTVGSGKSKDMSYTAGAAYLHALMLHGVDMDHKKLPHPNHLQLLLLQLEDTSGDSIILQSI